MILISGNRDGEFRGRTGIDLELAQMPRQIIHSPELKFHVDRGDIFVRTRSRRPVRIRS